MSIDRSEKREKFYAVIPTQTSLHGITGEFQWLYYDLMKQYE